MQTCKETNIRIRTPQKNVRLYIGVKSVQCLLMAAMSKKHGVNSHVHSYHVIAVKKRRACIMHAASDHRKYVQSAMQECLPGAVSDP